ncbi:efflux RND transporter periplasmic adaptor subunit [Marinospirillum sp.]|uniref:efflux RND transporter periplasmic adaptor subunit n=1 Tax=Marinospirillum sp. TaxID=2183934 RepID=UPI00384DA205
MKKFVAGSLMAFCGLWGVQAQALETQGVEQAPLVENLRLDGVLEAIHRTTVSAQTSGQVQKIHFDVDDRVAAGEVILELDASEQKARLMQAQGALQEAAAGLEAAQSNFNRVEALFQREQVSRSQMDEARRQLKSAQARKNQAEAAVDEARQQLAYTRVVAPYEGLVTQRHVEEGASVSPGQPLISGLSLEDLRVVVALPQRYAAAARNQREAVVRLDEDRVLETQSMTFYPYADPATHTFRVRMNINNSEGDLFPGMLVKVHFPVGQRPALWIPTSALVERGELRAVYVVKESGLPRLRHIRVGQMQNGRLEVLSGLSQGEAVVLNPAEALQVLEEQL